MFEKKKYKAQEKISLLAALKKGGTEGQLAFETIYRNYHYEYYLKKLLKEDNSLSIDVKDIIHDSMVIFRDNVISRKVDSQININVYITSIAKNIILNKNRILSYKEITNPEKSIYGFEDSVDKYYTRKDQVAAIQDVFSFIGIKCKSILRLWQMEYNYEEIASKLGYDSPRAAKRQKFNCIKKIQENLDNFPELKDLLS